MALLRPGGLIVGNVKLRISAYNHALDIIAPPKAKYDKAAIPSESIPDYASAKLSDLTNRAESLVAKRLTAVLGDRHP